MSDTNTQPSEQFEQWLDAGEPFGRLRLVDEVCCGEDIEDGEHLFAEGPSGASSVQTILGQPCRVLPVAGEAKYFAYRLGRGKGLRAGAAYVLAVEYPEDVSRTMVVQNRGAEYARGVHTGQAIGDVLYTFTNNNCESLGIPLSGRFEQQRSLFWLHEHLTDIFQPRGIEPDHRGKEDDVDARPLTPEDGFWVVICQPEQRNIPLGEGAAVSRIRLFEVSDPQQYDMPIHYPEGLPRRHIFFREEMSDGIINSRRPSDRGVEDQTRWFEYKARLMKFLGVNTWGKDILEFGGNPPFDTTYRGGGERWYRQTRFPTRWADQLEMLGRYDIDVLPFIEYAGSDSKIDGLGREKRCRTLTGTDRYTHVVWSEKYNADVSDPDTLVDVKKVLDCAIVRYRETARFVGAWFRTRPSHLPISFSDRCLALFADEANEGATISREQLAADAASYERYLAWWHDKRKAFLIAIRDYLREQGFADAEILFTADSTEPGAPLRNVRAIVDENLDIPRGSRYVVTDDVVTWQEILRDHEEVVAVDLDAVVEHDLHLAAATSPQVTWGEWEWQHSVPPADPQRYRDVECIYMTMPINRAYSVSSPNALDAFREKSGLALIRHIPLNEGTAHKDLGYFVTDMDRPREYCMLIEARAVAFGDPKYLGYMHSNSFNRCSPEYVRKFNAAFLSLPALPSEVLPDASDHPDVVVRRIDAGEKGVYLAVVNVGLCETNAVRVRLPAAGRVVDLTSGAAIEQADGRIVLNLHAAELRALHIERP